MNDKVILVINKPKICLECPCYSFNAQAKRFECNAKLFLKGKIDVVKLDKKPNWCPLNPLPEEIDEFKFPVGSLTRAVVSGYNICLDEIKKGQNEK